MTTAKMNIFQRLNHNLEKPKEKIIHTKYKIDQPKYLNNLTAGKGFSLTAILLSAIYIAIYKYSIQFIMVDFGLLLAFITYFTLARPLILNGFIKVTDKENTKGMIIPLTAISSFIYSAIYRLAVFLPIWYYYNHIYWELLEKPNFRVIDLNFHEKIAENIGISIITMVFIYAIALITCKLGKEPVTHPIEQQEKLILKPLRVLERNFIPLKELEARNKPKEAQYMRIKPIQVPKKEIITHAEILELFNIPFISEEEMLEKVKRRRRN